MPPSLPAPDPIGIPAPPILLQVLLVFTYGLHSLFVGVVFGGTVLALATRLAGRSAGAGGAAWAAALGSHLRQALPVAMAFSITTGVAPLLFVQLLFGQFFYTASVFVGWTWFSVVPVLMVGYYALYYWSTRGARAERPPYWSLGITLAALVWVAFAMVTNMSLYPHPERFAAVFNFAGTALNVSEPTFVPRYVHALLNFLAVGASYVLAVAHVVAPPGSAGARALGRFALAWLAGALAVQAAASAWYWAALGAPLKEPAATAIGSVVGLAGGVLTLGGWFSAHRASAAGRTSARWWAVLGALGTVTMAFGLAVARHGVRMASLAPYLQPEAWKLSPQWPQFVLFVILLLAGLVFVGYLLWRYPWRKGIEELRV